MKPFDFAYQETCVAANQALSRYDFWTAAALGGAHPAWNPTSDQLANWLEQAEGSLLSRLRQRCGPEKWNKLVRRVRDFGPEHDTPEEIMERLCAGR
jgi:hypothetical protein